MPGKWPQAKPKHENLIASSTDGGRPLLTKLLVYHSSLNKDYSVKTDHTTVRGTPIRVVEKL